MTLGWRLGAEPVRQVPAHAVLQPENIVPVSRGKPRAPGRMERRGRQLVEPGAQPLCQRAQPGGPGIECTKLLNTKTRLLCAAC